MSNKELFEWAGIKDLPVVGPGEGSYPNGAHAEIVARKEMLVPNIKPEHDVKHFIRNLPSRLDLNEWDVERTFH